MVSADHPETGFYRVRLIKGGPWVCVSIAHTASQPDRSPMWVAKRGTEYVDIWDVWPGCSGQPITEAEYNYLLKDHLWSVDSAPESPQANPRAKIDLHREPTVF